MTTPMPVWPSWRPFCSNPDCPCIDPNPAPCEAFENDPDEPVPHGVLQRCGRCGWPTVSHGLEGSAFLAERDLGHVAARVRAALHGLEPQLEPAPFSPRRPITLRWLVRVPREHFSRALDQLPTDLGDVVGLLALEPRL